MFGIRSVKSKNMPDLTTIDQEATLPASDNRVPPLHTPPGIHLEGRRKNMISKSLILWPLVVLSLIQVASNLVSYQNPTPLQVSIIDLTTELRPGGQTYPAAVIVDISYCKRTSELEEHQQSTFHINSKQKTSHDGEISDHEVKNVPRNSDLCSSSAYQFSSSNGLLSSSFSTYLSSSMNLFAQNIYTLLSQIEKITTKTIFGQGILLADAAQVSTNPLYKVNYDKAIIVLNSTNFNTELIQYNHPFPHIKLVEYYLAYCGICLRFKQTYVQLSKEISPWRNVIRPSAIDLGLSSNSPIAHSWSIDVIPTLRIHPPPNSTTSAKLNEQLSAKISKSTQSDLQKTMYAVYSEANLMIDSLGVFKYTNESKTLAERVASLKLDLIRYIENYVDKHPGELPMTWPNLRPITEKNLTDLRLHHPRQELFILVEAGGNTNSDQLAPSEPSLGLQIMMELSSSASWQAIRYVRANDNRALIQDLIEHKKSESSEQIIDTQGNNNRSTAPGESIELLNNLLQNKQATENDENRVVLVHIDFSHWPSELITKTPATKFPSITIVTESDLVTVDQDYSSSAMSSNDVRTRRAIRSKRNSASDDDDQDNLKLQRKLSSIAQYINQTYIEVDEDRSFLKSLKSFDENPTSHSSDGESFVKFQTAQQENKIALSDKIKKSQERKEESASANSTFNQFLGRMNTGTSDRFAKSKTYQDTPDDDYEDKLKAIRYIFFQEVPRATLSDKSPAQKLEKVNALINLASVIRAYFPLPDLASVQFMEAIHSYLIKQRQSLSTLISDQNDRTTSQTGNNFDFRALKQVIKSLEAEGKRLPEIKDWKHCKYSGYPCALWRLFHTLTAFEYKKLSQISQQFSSTYKQLQNGLKQQPVAEKLSDNQTLATDQQQSNESKPLPSPMAHHNGPSPPVERLVSPPSTTTSLSLTIATPISTQDQQHAATLDSQNNNNRKRVSEAELPEPVLLAMKDYITNFFSCEECAKNFQQETMDLNIDRIRHQEPAEFSVLWLWETHNRISKRLSINSDTNPSEHPKKWFPSYDQCPKCYNKPPSYLKDTSIELAAIFHESIQWNREEVLSYLVEEYTRQPMDGGSNIFGYQIPYGCNYVIIIGVSSFLLIVLLRCASCYIERQRRHKASLLSTNGGHYSVELQSH